MKTIHIASTNPVKVNAAVRGFQSVFPGEEFIAAGFQLQHGVPDQPVGDRETLAGARTRATLCREEYPGADYWVGIEGGVEALDGGLQAFAWVVVLSGGRTGCARTASFLLPPEVARLVASGMELGQADDQVFGRSNSKQKNGAVGLLTGDRIDREGYYRHAVVLALIPFLNPELYPARDTAAD